jgi:hypothetical protein
MRVPALVAVSGLILAIAVVGTIGLDSHLTESNTPVVAACSVQGKGCNQPSLDGGGQFVISHDIFAAGCYRGDRHVMRYLPAGGSASPPLIATWCSSSE